MPTMDQSQTEMDWEALYAKYGFVYRPIGGGDGSNDDGDGDGDAGSDDTDGGGDEGAAEHEGIEAYKTLVAKLRKENRQLAKQVKRAGRADETSENGNGMPDGDGKSGTGGDDRELNKVLQRMEAYEATIAAMQRKEQVSKVSTLATKAAKAAGAESPSAVARMIHLDALDLDDDADDEDLADAITEAITVLKEEEPILFGQRRRSANGSGDGGEGTSDRRKKAAPKDAFGLSRMRYAYEEAATAKR